MNDTQAPEEIIKCLRCGATISSDADEEIIEARKCEACWLEGMNPFMLLESDDWDYTAQEVLEEMGHGDEPPPIDSLDEDEYGIVLPLHPYEER